MDVRAQKPKVVTLGGELDISRRDEVWDLLAPLAGEALVVVDLSAASYIDSSGISALVRLKNALDASGGELRLVLGSANVERTLRIAGLVPQIAAFDSLAAASAHR